jgi:hypothetical protein
MSQNLEHTHITTHHPGGTSGNAPLPGDVGNAKATKVNKGLPAKAV